LRGKVDLGMGKSRGGWRMLGCGGLFRERISLLVKGFVKSN